MRYMITEEKISINKHQQLLLPRNQAGRADMGQQTAAAVEASNN